MREFLENLFRAAIDAADPALVLPSHLPPPPAGRTIVVGAGKAAASMAKALEDNWSGSLEGLVITRYGYATGPAASCTRIKVIEAAHPVPDAAGLRAAQQILSIVQGLNSDDLVICLISGGGSALLSVPADGLTLADKQSVNSALLRSGAPISAMNVVRKHLSAIKGGRLAVAAYPAKVDTLIISDVPGDDPSVVASGPTVADASTLAEARDILRTYKIEVPAHVRATLADVRSETPKPGDLVFDGNEVRVIASASGSLEAAANAARGQGWTAHILGDAIEGEATAIAKEHAAKVRKILSGVHDLSPPCLLLSSGETTVTMHGSGRGGRNGEYMLALAVALEGQDGVFALAGDTDGIDGSEENAGAWIDPQTLFRARERGFDAEESLRNNDSFTLFEATDDLIFTGPTLTNVNDFRAIAIVGDGVR